MNAVIRPNLLQNNFRIKKKHILYKTNKIYVVKNLRRKLNQNWNGCLCKMIKGSNLDFETSTSAIRNNANNTMINRTAITRKQKWEEKQVCGYFKRQTSELSHENTRTWLRKRNLMRETKSIRKAAQNNVIRTNLNKAKIDNTEKIVNVGYVVKEMKRLIT